VVTQVPMYSYINIISWLPN